MPQGYATPRSLRDHLLDCQAIHPMKQRLTIETAIAVIAGTLALCASVGIVASHWQAAREISSPFRIGMPSLCLMYALLLSAYRPRLGLMACVFALPLIPNFTAQLQAFTGYGRIAQIQLAGWDLAIGLALGLLLHRIFVTRDALTRAPTPLALAFLYLTISAIVAIARNLSQTQSLFSLDGLLYNIWNIRSINWHNDYRPLMDWVSYACAFIFFFCAWNILRTDRDRNGTVFKPLIAGLLLNALLGIAQSQTGRGLPWFFHFFRTDSWGFVALGFQPDLHAYAGLMLIGAFGLFSYLWSIKQGRLITGICVLVICLSWIGLFLSKSKASLGVAVLIPVLLAVMWRFRNHRLLHRSLIGILLILLVLAVMASIAPSLLFSALNSFPEAFPFVDWAGINLKLTYRPEIFIAAGKIFLLFPWFGLGLGEFFRQSANHSLTNSYFLSVEQNGENAHNYFLQTLTETGLIGTFLFLIILIYPLFATASRRALLPAGIALLALFSGNLFAHSLLIRENLLLATALLALLYASIQPREIGSSYGTAIYDLETRMRGNTKICVLAVVIISVLVGKEIYQSFNNFPFTVDTQCAKERPLTSDGWTSGRYIHELPAGASAITFNVAGNLPNIERQPLKGSIQLLDSNKTVVLEQGFLLNNTAPTSIKAQLPAGPSGSANSYKAILTVGRCFVPRNHGSLDDRRLGVRLESVQVF